jgi:hypothetical protein
LRQEGTQPQCEGVCGLGREIQHVEVDGEVMSNVAARHVVQVGLVHELPAIPAAVKPRDWKQCGFQETMGHFGANCAHTHSQSHIQHLHLPTCNLSAHEHGKCP